MARIPRIMLIGEPTAYHIMSRTALEGYPIDDVDKDFFVERKNRDRLIMLDAPSILG